MLQLKSAGIGKQLGLKTMFYDQQFNLYRMKEEWKQVVDFFYVQVA